MNGLIGANLVALGIIVFCSGIAYLTCDFDSVKQVVIFASIFMLIFVSISCGSFLMTGGK